MQHKCTYHSQCDSDLCIKFLGHCARNQCRKTSDCRGKFKTKDGNVCTIQKAKCDKKILNCDYEDYKWKCTKRIRYGDTTAVIFQGLHFIYFYFSEPTTSEENPQPDSTMTG